MKRRLLLAAAAALLATLPAAADEDLVSGVSQDVVEITSNYTGTDLTVFGDVEQPEDAAGRDIVVVVRGPDARITVRRKDRFAGIWINNARAQLIGMPSYYFLASTRPLEDIAAPDTLRRYDLGLDNLRPERALSDGSIDPYVRAMVRALGKRGLYVQSGTAVEMLSATLFRVRVPVPATVPRGSYNVQVYLFRDGNVVSAQSTPLFVDQTGFDRRLYTFAHRWPFSYGVSTVLMALLFGWASSFLFRRKA
ncbi:MAG: TIGR02186 family protein [Alphaproteobacteria bacterium]|nr:TIGR02186 family protein [Alphaproteobacteria bacterium]MDE2110434.1 TIGR02186 family protein [Alphaproteobacteria bacterium]MDE2493407.1 TIGR02186 family protein [Alphaproteobacteria bacterium]